MILEEVTKRPSHATVVTLKDILRLLQKKIPPSLIAVLLTVTTVRTTEVV